MEFRLSDDQFELQDAVRRFSVDTRPLGIAGQSLELARDYALTREQFNVSIGSFQALKHLMAHMFLRVELARSATYAAACVLDNPRVGDPGRFGTTEDHARALGAGLEHVAT
jgi:alkylation response protein AidB-like acyl-CoA dehydrogenase